MVYCYKAVGHARKGKRYGVRAGGLASHTTPAAFIYGGEHMVIQDIIAFAKNGVSPADMKDLIAQGYTAKDIAELLAADVNPAEEIQPDDPAETPADPEDGNDKKPAPEKQAPDYKVLYDAEKKRREDLERSAAHKQTDPASVKDDFTQALESVQSFL